MRAVLTAAVEHLSVRGSRLTGGILLLVCLFAVASGIAVTFVDPFGWRGGQAQGSLIQEQPGRSPEARIVQLRGVDPVMPPTPPLPSGSYLGSNPGSGSAEVRVISTPPGAEVSLSGEPLGVTPLDAYIERRTGSEPLTIHHARYQDVMHAVDLSHDVEQTVVLVPLESGPQRTLGGAPPSGTILDTEIAADVDGAMVEIVGTDQRGPAPFTAKLEDGKPYKVRITARGFATEELDIKGGDPRQIAKPVPKPRFVVISSDPPGAQIFIDGTATRHVTPFQIELTAAQAAKKSVRVVLRKAGFRVLDRTIDMAKFTDGDTRMTAELDEMLAPLPPVTRPPLWPPR